MTTWKKPDRSFADLLTQEGTVAVDGAMGTQLYERGVLYSTCFEELNLSRPELIRRVHEDYLRAGAQVIETNTFGANAMRLEKHALSHRVREVNVAAVQIAREAADGRAYVTGAIGPSGYFLGEASVADLDKVRASLLEQARVLVEADVDAIVVETFRQTNELRVAVEAAVAASGGKIPVIGSASVDERSLMADGTPAGEIARLMKEWGASVVGVNCSDGPMTALEAVEAMLPHGLPVWAVPNAGLPRRVDERLVYVSTPEYFGVYARRLFKLGVRFVGGCCGTTPDHVRRIAAAGKMLGSSDRDRDAAPDSESIAMIRARGEAWSAYPDSEDNAMLPVSFPERSPFAKKIGKRFVVSVEVNPPIGMKPSRAVEAAKMLKAGGVDIINIADGARAQARMSNLAMAVRIARDADMETLVHVCGRDRNLLGTLAHLLGAHDLGIRNLVIVTGDPPKMGDFPDASAVYDLDSIGILKLASRLNHGIDPGGKALGGVTSFVLATGAEPAALNYPREITRLEQKKAAGAELVMTQPVYDASVLTKFLDDIAPLELPVMVGVLPLASYRNAEFLHNEVPGMQVPLHIRERMRKAGAGVDGRKEGRSDCARAAPRGAWSRCRRVHHAAARTL